MTWRCHSLVATIRQLMQPAPPRGGESAFTSSRRTRIVSKGWPMVPLGEVATSIQGGDSVIPGREYRTLGVKWWGQGTYERETVNGSQTAAGMLYDNRTYDYQQDLGSAWLRCYRWARSPG